MEATLKDGSVVNYKTIEEASKQTGLSINSIKSRANKPGSGAKSKDGITFKWADEKVRRSHQAKKNKQKGNAFELQVAQRLRECGYTDVVSARSINKMADANKIDLVSPSNSLPFNMQCKYTQSLPNYFDIRDACTDKSLPFCLIWKKASKDGSNSRGTVVVVPEEYFYRLITKR